MKTKMNSTQTMMKTPPNVMMPVAARSASFTRAIRCEAAAILSRTPMLAVAIGGSGSGKRMTTGGRRPAGPARAKRGYSSLASSSLTRLAGSGR